MAEEANYLECSVCFQRFDDTPKRTPRSLFCGHTFCTTCLEQLVVDDAVHCPTCRQKQTFSKGIRDCNKNFALLELLGKLESPEIICVECEEHKAAIWCTNCESSFCEKCNGMIHKFKSSRRHKLVKLCDKPVDVVCAEHKERYHFFCEDCTVPVCYICKDSDHGKHGTHTTQLLLTAEIAKREILDDRRSELETVAKNLESKSLEVAATSKLVVNNEAKHERQIQETALVLIEEINKQSLELRNEVKKMASEKTETLQKYHQDLGTSYASVTTLIEESKQLLLNKDKLRLLLDVKALVSRMDTSIESGQAISSQPVTSCYIGCALDTTDVIQSIQGYGGVGVPNIPENVALSSITSTSGQISWASSTLNSVPHDSFVVQYREHEEKEKDNVWKETEISKSQTKTLIKDFHPNCSYLLRVCAVNHIGRGQWTSEIEFKTKPTPPAPQNPVCSDITYTSAEVKWKPPKLSPLAPGDSYVVQYGEDVQGSVATKDLEVAPPTTGLTLKNLTPNTSHTVRVCASNQFGSGVWTADVKFKTRSIPKPQVNSSVSWGSVDISWTSPNSSEFSYVVQYNDEVKNGDIKDLDISKGTTSTRLTELSDGTSYFVRVRAFVSKESGEWSSDVKFTTQGFKSTTLLDGTSGPKLIEFLGGLKSGSLLYKASVHGFAASAFHQRCDNKGPTLTIIKSTGSSTIYGGYTPVPWDSTTQGSKRDDQLRSFVFTMCDDNGNPAKFKHKEDPQYAIYCYSTNGPTFGVAFAICIVDNSNTSKGSSTGCYWAYGVPTKTTLCGQNTGYTIDDIEVFIIK